MPVYEYSCQKCQKDCELLIRGGEKPVCPHCGSQKLNRQMSASAAHAGGVTCFKAHSCGLNPDSCEQGSGGCGAGRCPF